MNHQSQIFKFSILVFLLMMTACAVKSSTSTDKPVLDGDLPPDPGIAGLQTIEGIDSDDDGVRDDIERYIVTTYPDEPDVQSALVQRAKADQIFIRDANDPEKTIQNDVAVARGIGCLYYRFSAEKAHQINMSFDAAFLNTKERILADYKASSHLSGSVYHSPADPATDCDE